MAVSTQTNPPVNPNSPPKNGVRQESSKLIGPLALLGPNAHGR